MSDLILGKFALENLYYSTLPLTKSLWRIFSISSRDEAEHTQLSFCVKKGDIVEGVWMKDFQ